MSASRPPLTKRIWAAASFAGSGAILVIWFLLTGGLGAKDFTGDDLRATGDCTPQALRSRTDAACTRFQRQDMVKSNFQNANISGLDMTGIAWHESNLQEVIAQATNLTQAVIRRCDARNADFRGAYLREADFENCDLRGADFRGADIRGVSFRHANLQGADLRNTLAGPSCDRDRLYNTHPDHCQFDANGCCPMVFMQGEVQGLEACTEPFYEIIRNAATIGQAEGQERGFGVLGEATFQTVIRYDNGRAICVEPEPLTQLPAGVEPRAPSL